MNDSWPYCSLWQATQLAAYQNCPEETNMSHDLTGVKIASLIAQGFDQEQLLESQKLLHEVGATVTTVSAASGDVPETGRAGKPLATITVEAAEETGFDALFLPGGQTNADSLCRIPAAINFVRAFIAASKPIAAMTDGVKVLAAADGIAGLRVAADPGLKGPIQKAGGVWIDKPVARDRFLVTAAGTASKESFFDAFAKSCTEHKAGSGASLHTD
jgi:protease I